MSEGFLADLGLDEIDDDPNAFPDGGYNAFVFEAKVVNLKDAAKGKRLVLTYKLADGEHKGKTIDEWKSCNAFDDAKTKAWLKKRILSLGVPEDRIASLDPADLVGTEVFIKTKKNGTYRNVQDVQLGHVHPEGEGAAVGASVGGSTSSDLDDLL